MLVVLLSLVWVWRTVTFQLSGSGKLSPGQLLVGHHGWSCAGFVIGAGGPDRSFRTQTVSKRRPCIWLPKITGLSLHHISLHTAVCALGSGTRIVGASRTTWLKESSQKFQTQRQDSMKAVAKAVASHPQFVGTWTSEVAKIMDPVLPIPENLGYWSIILGSFGDPGTPPKCSVIMRPPDAPFEGRSSKRPAQNSDV